MKVLQIVPDIKEEASGPSYSVPALCASLCGAGCDVELHFTGLMPDRDLHCPAFAYPTSKFPHKRVARSPEMLAALRHRCKVADVIHSHSIWMYPNVYPAWAKKETKCKLVTAPRGTLSKWSLAHHSLRKKLFGIYAQYAALRATDMWHATCDEEYEEIRTAGYGQPVVILPNGVDLPNTGLLEKASRRRMFFLSRIHPKKNLEMLIRCWSRLEGDFLDWDLSIVGPDKNNRYADDMKALANTLGCQRVFFEGEKNGEDKYLFMAESECEILPTHSENFGMVVAESLACGTPVICSRGAPWKNLEKEKCGWWIEAEDVAFENVMRDVMSMHRETLCEMGKRGRDWVVRDFSWKSIGNKMKTAYEWLLGKGDKPEWVVVD